MVAVLGHCHCGSPRRLYSVSPQTPISKHVPRMRPLLGTEKEAGKIQNVNIMDKKNMELIKTQVKAESCIN